MKRISIYLILTIIFVNSFHSQYFYTPSLSNGNPGGLNMDNEYPFGSGLDTSWKVLLPAGSNSPVWSVIDSIPFSFNFNNNLVDQFKVSSSGVLTFDINSTIIPGFGNVTIPDPAIPNNSVMVWGLEGTGSNDNIVTKTFGNPGGQQFWVFFSSYTAGSWTYWSIVLEEGSNKIYIVDQRHSSSAAPAITAGIQIDSANAVMVTGSPSLSNLAGTDPSPSDNHYYEFTYGAQNSLDVSGVDFVNDPYLHLNDAPYSINGVFRNLGLDTIINMKINYSVNGGNTISEYISNLNIGSYQDDTASFNTLWSPTIAGTYDIAIWADSLNGGFDMDNSNDTLYKNLHVFDISTQRIPLLETFASSTSQFSVTGNIDLHNILSTNQNDYTLVKYPMSWPSPGDPYYTLEGRQRRLYYSINTVPRIVNNGIVQFNPIGFTQQEFDDAKGLYSFMDLSTEYSVGGQTIDISVNIDPLCNTAGIWDNLVLHTAVYEKTTYNNSSVNGEIEFYNIMKKLIPDANGTSLSNLSGPNNPTTVNLTYTFNGLYNLPPDSDTPIDHTFENSVEDFQNLGVAVWIQDVETKYVLQSSDGSIVTSSFELDKKEIKVFPNPSSEFVNILLPLNHSPSTIEIYDVIGNMIFSDKLIESKNNYKINLANFRSGIYQ
ncbi:MAG: T9SS type A sorting domain-containing protein, partial [Flavobacteriales bacterium]|nr:T9SS type A sorting domain-containing protein [Flavobacteriales bacterium]